MQAIIIRDKQYLNNRYEWTHIPDLFPEWQFAAVMRVMMHEGNTQKPTGWAAVDGSQVIDLDKLEIKEI